MQLKPQDGGFYRHGDHSGILAALKASNYEVVQCLLAAGLDVNAQIVDQESMKSTSILLMAVEESCRRLLAGEDQCESNKVVELLVEHGACVQTAVHRIACEYSQKGHKYFGSFGIVGSLFQYSQTCSDNSTQVKSEQRFLLYSQMMKILLDMAVGIDIMSSHPDRYAIFDYMDVKGFNFIGVSYRGQPITRQFLEAKNCINVEQALFTLRDLEQLQSADQKQAITRRVEALASKRAILTSEDGYVNLVALNVSAEFRDTITVELRLNSGCNPNESYDDVTGVWSEESCAPIVRAARHGYTDIVMLFAGADGIDKTSIVDAYFSAKKHNHPDIYQILFNKLDFNLTLAEGNTLLHKAILNKDVDMALCLIDQGVSLCCKNDSGYTPIRLAAEKLSCYSEFNNELLLIMRRLLRDPAKPDTKDYYSALDKACEVGCGEAVEMLVEHVDKAPVKKRKICMFSTDPIEYELLPWYIGPLKSCLFHIEHMPNKNKNDIQKILQVLVSSGADLDYVDESNETIRTLFPQSVLELVNDKNYAATDRAALNRR